MTKGFKSDRQRKYVMSQLNQNIPSSRQYQQELEQRQMQRCEIVAKHFGTNTDIETDGWVLPDGRKIDMDNRDHMEIVACLGKRVPYEERDNEDILDKEWRIVTKWRDNCNAVRYSNVNNEILTFIGNPNKPTSEQVAFFVKAVKNLNPEEIRVIKAEEEFNWAPLGELCKCTRKNPTPLDVQICINKCW